MNFEKCAYIDGFVKLGHIRMLMLRKKFVLHIKNTIMPMQVCVKNAAKMAYDANPERKKEATILIKQKRIQKWLMLTILRKRKRLLILTILRKRKRLQKWLMLTILRKRKTSKVAYAYDPETKRKASKKAYEDNAEKRKDELKENYSKHRKEICT